MRTELIQARIEPELDKHIRNQVEYNLLGGMSNYIRNAIIVASKYEIKEPKRKKRVAV